MTFYILVIILTIYRLPLLTIRTLLRPVKNSYKVTYRSPGGTLTTYSFKSSPTKVCSSPGRAPAPTAAPGYSYAQTARIFAISGVARISKLGGTPVTCPEGPMRGGVFGEGQRSGPPPYLLRGLGESVVTRKKISDLHESCGHACRRYGGVPHLPLPPVATLLFAITFASQGVCCCTHRGLT